MVKPSAVICDVSIVKTIIWDLLPNSLSRVCLADLRTFVSEHWYSVIPLMEHFVLFDFREF